MTNRKLIDKIAEYFTEKREVAAVYLFGSYARGREKEGSDVDLGILLDRDVSSGENDLRTTYLIDLARILRKDLHIVMMNDAGEGIIAQIFKYGKCVFQRNPWSLARFKTARYSMIAEFGYLRAIMEKAFVLRLFGRTE
jgi:predicted nucleotidyltransferase